jgi:acetyl esterase/lipase
MMLALRDAGDPLPLRAALFSPWTDLAVTGATVDSNSDRDPMFSAAMVRRAPAAYLGEADPLHPLASPVFAELAGLPPLLIHVGDREVLLDDSRRLAVRARAAGVDVTLSVWPAVPHVWQLAQALVPEARQSMRQAGAFLLAGTAAAIPARAAA